MNVAELAALATELVALVGVMITGIVSISKVFDGQRCLLRSEMLKIYYKHQQSKEIRQYEYENFFLLYDAYKKLKGNSFIDKVAKEIKGWTVRQ
ncbi:MAG: hypothetical protein IJL30_00600 [Clostridia bacterium]|nr:hypothetical protein [Clostridia bacterium]